MSRIRFVEVLVVSNILYYSIDLAETMLSKNMNEIIAYAVVVLGLFLYCKHRDNIKNIVMK